MKIAVDAMGGDNAPKAVVEGALRAAKELKDTTIVLYGDQEQIKSFLLETPKNIEIIHTSEKIHGDDDPVRAVRRKKDSSMVRAARDTKEGAIDALVSAGNTGALLAAGTLIVGRIRGIDRPALMTTFPSLYSDDTFLFMDLGANADCKPINLEQFAVLGSYYSKTMHQKNNPTIGLLNNGTEDNKGNDLAKKSFDLLKGNESINFIGNVEAKELLKAPANVIITDGFTGNAVLKTLEGTAKGVIDVIKSTIQQGSIKTKLGGLMIKDDLSSIKDVMDYSKLGGAILFGVKAPVIKTHGSANSEAIYHTIKQAKDILNTEVITDLTKYFERIK